MTRTEVPGLWLQGELFPTAAGSIPFVLSKGATLFLNVEQNKTPPHTLVDACFRLGFPPNKASGRDLDLGHRQPFREGNPRSRSEGREPVKDVNPLVTVVGSWARSSWGPLRNGVEWPLRFASEDAEAGALGTDCPPLRRYPAYPHSVLEAACVGAG